MKKISRSENETQKIARAFIDKILREKRPLQGALIVKLSGELGAGKTAFVRAVARYLGAKSKITSPTFTLVKKHHLKHEKYKLLFHLDAYRLRGTKELGSLKWEEIIAHPEHLVFIEWPENIASAIPPAKFVRISHTRGGHRLFEL